ncbi:MAG TPA: diguanylate cyclase [Campylobacterales bacterium]|nr:diguanylate cyclase [Campylobacterales bacterium]
MSYKINAAGKILDDNIITLADEVEVDDGKLKELEQKKKLKQLNMFSKQVTDRLIKDNIPPTPANFTIYFEKLLEDKTPTQKESIDKILDLNSSEYEIEKEYMSKTDSFLKENFDKTKKLMDGVNEIYSKVNKIKSAIKSKSVELTKNPTKANVLSFEKSISSMISSLQQNQESLKENYIGISALMKSFNKESIFDKKYGVYNKKYLFDSIEAELSNLKNFHYKGVIISFKVKDDILKSIKLQMDRDLLIKTVASIVLERSRRSDIIAHFDDGIFILLLKHTDTNQAQKAIKSIQELISFSNFFIDSKNIKVQFDYCIKEIDTTFSAEILVGTAIEGLY